MVFDELDQVLVLCEVEERKGEEEGTHANNIKNGSSRACRQVKRDGLRYARNGLAAPLSV